MAGLKLYSYWRSSSAWRVRIALELKGIPYTIAPVSLIQDGGEQNQESYKSNVNPMKQVPALDLGNGSILTQSVAILEYLEEAEAYQSSEPRLLPRSALERAIVRKLVELINSGIQPGQNLSLQKMLSEFLSQQGAVDKEISAMKLEWCKRIIEKGFDALEAELTKIHRTSPGDYCMGKTLTLADVFLVPQVYNAIRYKVDMDKYPTIRKIEATCSELAAFKKAHPSVQIDAK